LFPCLCFDRSLPHTTGARSELLRCVETLTLHHSRPVIEHIVQNMTNSSNNNKAQTGTISVLTHLINAQSESIEIGGMKETVLSGTIRIINSQDLDVRASLAQLIVALGTANFLSRDSGRELILFVVRQCRVTRNDIALFDKQNGGSWFGKGGNASGVTPKQLGKAR
jgi:isochorismate synthase EntC